jgi:TPR repeat protein
MKKYYLMAIENNNQMAIFNLALYYHFTEKDYNLMKEYYLMAIEKGNSTAMNNLGLYYKVIENNYDLMKEYLLMAIEKGHIGAMFNLAHHYQTTEINVDLMVNYYLMAIKLDDLCSMYNLELYYDENPLELFVLLNNIDNKNRLINDKLIELRENKRVKQYFKLLKSKKIELDCCVCLEIKSNLLPKCKHLICQDCFIKINKCPVCRKDY